MLSSIEEEKKKVEMQKKKILLRERLLKEKERKKKFRRFSEIVEIAFKADLEKLDDTTLLGAFLEISEKMHNLEILKKWKNSGEQHLKENSDKVAIPFSISFEKDPEKEIKEKLKEMKFRWNSFRKEFCGYGVKSEIEEALKNTSYSLEEIS